MFKLVLTFILMAVPALWGQAARADLITNGGFETGNFSGWTVTGDGIQIDAVFPNTGTYDAAFGASSSDSSPGTLSQTITTVAGASYALNFALLDESGLGTDSFSVSFGGFLDPITGDNASPFLNGSTLYTAEDIALPGSDITAASTVLSFQGLNDNGSDWNLDDVSLQCTANCGTSIPIPEPPGVPLILTAIAGWLAITQIARRSRANTRTT
jgi:hypothetical protein